MLQKLAANVMSMLLISGPTYYLPIGMRDKLASCGCVLVGFDPPLDML